MELRAVRQDEAEIAMGIIDQAKAYLKAQGVDQWQTGYPDFACIQEDIAAGKAYFLVDGEEILGYQCVDFDGEPSYEHLKGDWLSDGPYVVAHRMAFSSAHRGKGLASTAFERIAELARARGVRSFRVDTDEANRIMKHLLAKNGFVYCGTIWFDNSEKIAFEKLL